MLFRSVAKAGKSEGRVATAFAQDRSLLGQTGYTIESLLQQPGFVRALARKADDATYTSILNSKSMSQPATPPRRPQFSVGVSCSTMKTSSRGMPSA